MNKDITLQNGNITLINDDCLSYMKNISSQSVDLILCDLPYGVLNKNNNGAKWDYPINLAELFSQYNRIIKDNGAIVLFGQGMFSAELMLANKKYWRYNLIWDKKVKTGFLNAKRMPLRQHEDIIIFYKSLPTYNPQMVKSEPHQRNHGKGKKGKNINNCYGKFIPAPTVIADEKYPASIIEYNNGNKVGRHHPTEKPIELLSYLIKTYSNENDLILDNTMGSGSTIVAAIKENRKAIGIELDENFFNISVERCNKMINNE